MKLAYQYKLKPTKTQERLLWRLLEVACQLYNDALKERKDAWETEHRTVTFYDLPLSPKAQVVVYFNRQSAITDVAKIQLVRLTDQYVADPTAVTPLMEIDLTSYPAGQWFKVLVVNTEMSSALLRVMCRGTSGALWVGFEHLGERQFVQV